MVHLSSIGDHAIFFSLSSGMVDCRWRCSTLDTDSIGESPSRIFKPNLWLMISDEMFQIYRKFDQSAGEINEMPSSMATSISGTPQCCSSRQMVDDVRTNHLIDNERKIINLIRILADCLGKRQFSRQNFHFRSTVVWIEARQKQLQLVHFPNESRSRTTELSAASVSESLTAELSMRTSVILIICLLVAMHKNYFGGLTTALFWGF